MKTFVGFLFICAALGTTTNAPRHTTPAPRHTTPGPRPTGGGKGSTGPKPTGGSTGPAGGGKGPTGGSTGPAGPGHHGCTDPMRMKDCVKVYAMRTDKPAVCGADQKATCVELTVGTKKISCPSCLPGEKLDDLLDGCRNVGELPDCVAGAKPTITQGVAGLCPSCKLAFVADKCTKEKLDACKRTLHTADLCTKETVKDEPFDKETCCPACKPPSLACHEKDKKCATKPHEIPACPETERSEVTAATCCRSCMPKAVHALKRLSDKKEKWTRDQFKKALRHMPECELGEKPEKDNRLPVPTCKRPQSKRTLKDVVECMRGKAECESFQEFRDILPGQACPACKPPKPTCAPACEDNKICVPFAHLGRVNRTKGTKCVRKRKFKLRLRARKRMNTLREKMKTMTKEEFVELLREIVSRFCERTDDEVKASCDKRLELIISSLKCNKLERKGKGDKAEVEVEIEVSDEDSGEVADTGRRLLQSDNTETVIKDAVNDSEEVEDPAADGNPSTKLAAGFGIAFVSLVGFMLA